MAIREMLERLERDTLSPRAAFSDAHRGRDRNEDPDPWRPAFQRDRDRILHCKAFRRLAHKTQVFLAPIGDHYRTRLTHTLEVAQIARTIARALALNELLAEAIALGHDLGHTPFGHSGEEVLDGIVPGGFNHYRQSLRVVEVVENDGLGLNLTAEVKDGIIKHSKGRHGDIFRKGKQRAITLEGDVVRAADLIAYVSHDIDDAFRAGMLKPADAPPHVRVFLEQTHSDRLRILITDVIEKSLASGLEEMGMTEEIVTLAQDTREFLFRAVYKSEVNSREFAKVEKILSELWRHVRSSPERYLRVRPEEPIEPQVTDFVAGMTDRYALSLYQQVFLPRPWPAV
jgi:dGTPase